MKTVFKPEQIENCGRGVKFCDVINGRPKCSRSLLFKLKFFLRKILIDHLAVDVIFLKLIGSRVEKMQF
jgi:hypothetical protein